MHKPIRFVSFSFVLRDENCWAEIDVKFAFGILYCDEHLLHSVVQTASMLPWNIIIIRINMNFEFRFEMWILIRPDLVALVENIIEHIMFTLWISQTRDFMRTFQRVLQSHRWGPMQNDCLSNETITSICCRFRQMFIKFQCALHTFSYSYSKII